MNVVFGDVTANNFDIVGVADFSDEITDARAQTARQDGFVVLSGPDEMVLAIKDGMGRTAV
jgi:dihydrodipicolinate synthase/N-acetylneuraminate lyase